MSKELNVVIRPYIQSDSGSLIRLIRELQAHERAVFDRMKDPADIGDGYIEILNQQIASHGGQILIAEANATIVGYAAVLTSIKQEDPDEIAYSYAMVRDIAVAESHRGTGVGRRLLTECEILALNAGAKWLRITALAANERALTVYRQAGFSDLFVDLEKPLS